MTALAIAQGVVVDGEVRWAIATGAVVLVLVVAGTLLYARLKQTDASMVDEPGEESAGPAPAVEDEDEAQLVADYAEGRIDEDEFRRRLDEVRRQRPQQEDG